MDDYEGRVGRLRRHQSVDVATLAARAEHDRQLADLLVRLPSPAGPRQDALNDQLKDLWAIANRLGCYDAADWIDRTIKGK